MSRNVTKSVSRRALFCVGAILTAMSTGCGAAEDGKIPEAEADAGVIYEGVRILATVERPNAGVVHFLLSDEGLGVGCDELIPADGMALPARSASDPRDCLTLFLDLTADDVPVPAALVAASESDQAEALVASRPLVEELSKPIPSVELPVTPSLQPMGGTQSTTAHSCADDAGSQAHFEEQHCDYSGGSDVIEYCDSGQWLDLYRTTAGAIRRNSFEEMLSCTTLADVIHEYWNGTSWPNSYTITNIPANYYHWSRWEGAASWQRRIHVYRVYPDGFFRSHSLFYNN